MTCENAKNLKPFMVNYLPSNQIIISEPCNYGEYYEVFCLSLEEARTLIRDIETLLKVAARKLEDDEIKASPLTAE